MSFKINESPGHDGVSFNVINKYFGEFCEPLKYLFNLWIFSGAFPGDLKIAKINAIYKGDSSSNANNYRSIAVLPCFSKMLERIMQWFSKYLTDWNILFDKQFRFQTGHSADHAIAQLVDETYKAFRKNEYNLSASTYLFKTLDTVNHSIQLKKLELCGITDKNYVWIKSYLSNRYIFEYLSRELPRIGTF